MTDRELMQQALDLLDDINQCSLPSAGIPLPAEIDHVMEALRARLVQPEPEADICCQDFEHCNRSCTPRGQWLAQKEAQREWQGLTEQEHMQIAIDCGCASADWVFYGAAVERKLKEKNNG